tara:strand:+ start:337 stop:696 length:360 start_codon:yes stop_codon:yes gene_type:complete
LGWTLAFLCGLFHAQGPFILHPKKQQFAHELRLCQQAWAKDIPEKCKLFGKIQLVDSFPDVKIKLVDNFPDIKVKKVRNFPDKPGLWQIVENFPDYKVQIVENFPDYKVKYVSTFPGCD